MEKDVQTALLPAVPLLLQLIGLTFAVLIDPYIRRSLRRIMLIITGFVFSLLVQNWLEFRLAALDTPTFLRTVTSIYGYSVRPLIPVLFSFIIGKNKKYGFVWGLIGVNTAIHLTALFSGVCFRFSESNHFLRGPLGYSCHIVSGILLLYLIVLTVREFTKTKGLERLIPVFNAALIVGATAADTFVSAGNEPFSFLTAAVVSSCVFYYIWLHLQFVREHEQALMAEQRIQIMMSQIQPHFLFNTLSTIQALCRTDPELAFDTTGKFGAYLRQNIESLGRPELIPVQEELEHVHIYTDIEALRFPDVHVEFDIEDLDFRIPALTVQPLVENAIRHGVRIRKNGLVTVRTRKTQNGHEIEIRDNGRGFDVQAFETGADGSHIGIRNVRERIGSMCGGALTIDSRRDEGTTVTIRIPARQEARPEEKTADNA